MCRWTAQCCPFGAQFQSDSKCEKLKCDVTLSGDKVFGKRKGRQGEEMESFFNINIKEDLSEKMVFDQRLGSSKGMIPKNMGEHFISHKPGMSQKN